MPPSGTLGCQSRVQAMRAHAISNHPSDRSPKHGMLLAPGLQRPPLHPLTCIARALVHACKCMLAMAHCRAAASFISQRVGFQTSLTIRAGAFWRQMSRISTFTSTNTDRNGTRIENLRSHVMSESIQKQSAEQAPWATGISVFSIGWPHWACLLMVLT